MLKDEQKKELGLKEWWKKHRMPVLCFGCLGIVVTIIILFAVIENQQQKQRCKDNGMEALCSDGDIGCKNDCKKLNKEFYKFKDSDAGECWCRKDDQTMRVW